MISLSAAIYREIVKCLDWSLNFVFGPICFKRLIAVNNLALASGVFYSKKDDDEFSEGEEVNLNEIDKDEDEEDVNDADTLDYDPPEE